MISELHFQVVARRDGTVSWHVDKVDNGMLKTIMVMKSSIKRAKLDEAISSGNNKEYAECFMSKFLSVAIDSAYAFSSAFGVESMMEDSRPINANVTDETDLDEKLKDEAFEAFISALKRKFPSVDDESILLSAIEEMSHMSDKAWKHCRESVSGFNKKSPAGQSKIVQRELISMMKRYGTNN